MPTILYEDSDLLVVSKPAGVLSQIDSAGGDSVPARLAAQGKPVLTVHRLDRATGGVMVYARNDKSAAALSALVGQHNRFVKTYLAVVCGEPSEPSGELIDLLYHDARRNKSYTVQRMRRGVREARLAYETLATKVCGGETYTLLRVRLHTGRTHQIRVQFASRRLPLAGDTTYGGRRGCSLALWSHALTFPHPTSGEAVTATSNPPADTFPWNLFDIQKDG